MNFKLISQLNNIKNQLGDDEDVILIDTILKKHMKSYDKFVIDHIDVKKISSLSRTQISRMNVAIKKSIFTAIEHMNSLYEFDPFGDTDNFKSEHLSAIYAQTWYDRMGSLSDYLASCRYYLSHESAIDIKGDVLETFDIYCIDKFIEKLMEFKDETINQ